MVREEEEDYWEFELLPPLLFPGAFPSAISSSSSLVLSSVPTARTVSSAPGRSFPLQERKNPQYLYWRTSATTAAAQSVVTRVFAERKKEKSTARKRISQKWGETKILLRRYVPVKLHSRKTECTYSEIGENIQDERERQISWCVNPCVFSSH